MKYILSIFLFLAIIVVSVTTSCNKGNINPNTPIVPINYTLDPNSTFVQELNTAGGWVYLDELPGYIIPNGSRGIIIYRMTTDEFKAYERQPPNTPNLCCAGAICTKLIVGDNFPFVKDTCTNTQYLLIDGSLFEGEGQFPLIQYNAVYDGNLLHIYN